MQTLERELATEQKERVELRQLAHSLDPALAARIRGWVGVGYIAVTLLGVYLLWRFSGIFTTLVLAEATGTALLVLCAVIISLRKRLLANTFNYHFAGWMVLNLLVVMLNRLYGVMVDSSLSHVLILDHLLVGSLSAAGGFLLYRALWAVVAGLSLSLCASLLWPVITLPAFLTAILLASGYVAYDFLQKGRSASKSHSETPSP